MTKWDRWDEFGTLSEAPFSPKFVSKWDRWDEWDGYSLSLSRKRPGGVPGPGSEALWGKVSHPSQVSQLDMRLQILRYELENSICPTSVPTSVQRISGPYLKAIRPRPWGDLT